MMYNLSTFLSKKNRQPIPMISDADPPMDIAYLDAIRFINTFNLDNITYDFVLDLERQFFHHSTGFFRNTDPISSLSKYFDLMGLHIISDHLKDNITVGYDRAYDYYLWFSFSHIFRDIKYMLLLPRIIRPYLPPCSVCGHSKWIDYLKIRCGAENLTIPELINSDMLINSDLFFNKYVPYSKYFSQFGDLTYFFFKYFFDSILNYTQYVFYRHCHDVVFHSNDFISLDIVEYRYQDFGFKQETLQGSPILGILPVPEDDPLHDELVKLPSIIHCNEDIRGIINSKFIDFDDWDRLITPPKHEKILGTLADGSFFE